MTDLAAEEIGDIYFQDPQGVFARLRATAPVTPVIMPSGGRAWLVTRYDDVRAALNDQRLTKDWTKHVAPEQREGDPVRMALNRHLLTADPPDHTRLRRLVVKAFTAGRVAALRPRIEEIAFELLDSLPTKAASSESPATVDLVGEFAFPLPVIVICELLGIPARDRDLFREWTGTLLGTAATPEEHRAAAVGVYEYFTNLIAEKRHVPADDLVSALIAVRDSRPGDGSGSEGSRSSLSEQELTAMLYLLLIAGHETTVNLIASGVLALLTHRAELARLRAEP
jgi:cytochrome P450